jgi:hypothetical protein
MHRHVFVVLLSSALFVALPRALAQETPPETPPAKASGGEKSSEKSDEFETSWFGIRPEIWYEPTLSAQAKVGGLQGALGTNLVPDNTTLDASKDLGVLTHTPKPRYLDFSPGPLGLEAYVDTRWISISLWGVTPFEYHGRTVVTQSFSFAGFTFSVSRPVETDLAQALGGADIKINIINNRFVRISPILAVRAFAIDWTVQDVGQPVIPGAKASTEDINFPLSVGRYKVFPYPEVGGEVRAGYRDIVEADLKLTGVYVNYLGVQATTALLDGGITGYVPWIPQLGLRLGYRYYYLHARTSDQKASKQFDGEVRIYGLTISAIVRF